MLQLLPSIGIIMRLKMQAAHSELCSHLECFSNTCANIQPFLTVMQL